MARGQSAAASNQLNLTNGVAQQQGQQAQQLESQLVPTYQNLLSTGYNTPQQASAATEQGMGAVNTSFDNAQNQLQEQAARTNNPASLTAGEDALALNRGTALGNESNNLQEQQFNNEMKGAQGLNSLYDTSQQTSNQMYGLGPSTLNARAAGTEPWGFNVGPIGFKS